jgi:hypothetical protein
MEVYLKEGFEYIPVWNGNRDLEESKQIKVSMRFQTGLDFTEIVDISGTVDQKKDWLSICEKVVNLKVNGKKATPEDICTVGGLAPLWMELKAAYKKESALDKKK